MHATTVADHLRLRDWVFPNRKHPKPKAITLSPPKMSGSTRRTLRANMTSSSNNPFGVFICIVTKKHFLQS